MKKLNRLCMRACMHVCQMTGVLDSNTVGRTIRLSQNIIYDIMIYYNIS